MGRWTSLELGATGSGQNSVAARDRLHKPDGTRRGFLWAPGHGVGATQFLGSQGLTVLSALVDAGYPGVSADLGLTRFGDSVARTQFSAARTLLQGAIGAAPGKVYLVGASMGASAVLKWAAENPMLVQAIALLIPALDLADIYANDRSGTAASIAAVYGGVPPDAENPIKNTAAYVPFPIKVWHSTDDPFCLPSITSTFIAQTGAQSQSLGAVGHSCASVNGREVVDFFRAYA